MSGDTEGWLRWVAARTEIVDLLHRYCAAVDDRDVSAVIACFAEDARLELEHGTLVADGHRGIREIFERAFADGLAGIGEVSTHATSGVVIDLRADRARVRSSTITVLIGGPRVIVRGVRLIDDVVLVEGGWCIAHRRHQPVWQWSPKTESAPEVLDPGRARPPEQTAGVTGRLRFAVLKLPKAWGIAGESAFAGHDDLTTVRRRRDEWR